MHMLTLMAWDQHGNPSNFGEGAGLAVIFLAFFGGIGLAIWLASRGG